MTNIKGILSDVGVPDPAQELYISLLEQGDATARTLSHRTGITRTSVYDHIKTLRSMGLVIERLIEGTTMFAVSDVRRLSTLLGDRVDRLVSRKETLDKNLESLIRKSASVQPKIRYFEGEEGVKQLMKDILWYDDIPLLLYWPYEQMLDFLGEKFLLWFNDRRKVRNIPIQTIWATEKGKKTASIFDDGEDVERRFLSQKGAPTMSYILYDQKVAFISSNKESFGFIVESAEFAALQKLQFDTLWAAAKK
ncbi:MAG TPA: helix-turn-helix domain-containing protein [Candidatus Fimivivens sp.]|nr:helix-turn-helix domain-containing protein [Candidatus Fimivivens sp.]